MQVRRFFDRAGFVANAIYDDCELLEGVVTDPSDALRQKPVPTDTEHDRMLVPVMRQDRPVYQTPTLHAIRARVQERLQQLHPGIKRFDNRHRYPAGLEAKLHQARVNMVLQFRSRR